MISFIYYFLIGFAVTSIIGGLVIGFYIARDIDKQNKEIQDKVNDSLKKGNRLN